MIIQKVNTSGIMDKDMKANGKMIKSIASVRKKWFIDFNIFNDSLVKLNWSDEDRYEDHFKIALWKEKEDSSTLQDSSCSKDIFQKEF